jgi:3-dehydroquinate dehydratase/shikimate dehydrogenase
VTGDIVHSILERTPEAALRAIEEAPAGAGLVEIRADALRTADVAGLVRRAGRPAVVTVRARADGGEFDGSTEEKRGILREALAAGAALVDVEWEGPLRELAFSRDASRTILSHHGGACATSALGRLYEAMAETKAARLKIVPLAVGAAELPAVKTILARARSERRELAAFASGAAGAWSRVFALSWGSWGTYGAAGRGRETGDGQLLTRDLLDVFRVRAIGEETSVYALCGHPVASSPSPALHAAGFRELGLDAVYVPLDATDLAGVETVVAMEAPRIAGLAVTIPLKVDVARRCAALDGSASCGAVNTVVIERSGWQGFNTDGPAACALIATRIDLPGRAVAIAGAGGTARAVAAGLVAEGAGVTLYGRDAAKTAEAAAAAGARSARWEDLPSATWDVLVHATPAGRAGEEFLTRRHLNGRVVLDAAYGPEPTPLVRAARARGLAVVDGYDLLFAQGCLQLARLTGRAAPEEAMAAAFAPWRLSASP